MPKFGRSLAMLLVSLDGTDWLLSVWKSRGKVRLWWISVRVGGCASSCRDRLSAPRPDSEAVINKRVFERYTGFAETTIKAKYVPAALSI